VSGRFFIVLIIFIFSLFISLQYFNRRLSSPLNYPNYSSPEITLETVDYAYNINDYEVFLDSLTLKNQLYYGKTKKEQIEKLKELWKHKRDIITHDILSVKYMNQEKTLAQLIIRVKQNGKITVRRTVVAFEKENGLWKFDFGNMERSFR